MELRFPIQGGLSVKWSAAERAYAGYVRVYGDPQTLSRLAERGGFGLGEFVSLVCAASASSLAQAKQLLRVQPPDAHYAAVLAESDIRVEL